MEEQSTKAPHLAPELDAELLVKMFLSDIDNEGTRFDTLDSKAGLILGFGLVSMAELASFLLLASSEAHSARVGLSLAARVFFYLGLALLTVGSVSAMRHCIPGAFRERQALSAPKSWTTPQGYSTF